MAKVAVITGSNGLIGQATCRRLAQSGHLAVGIDVGAEGAGNWPHYQCDLRDLARMEATLAAIERDHGLIRVLFNNAGIFSQERTGLMCRLTSSMTRCQSMCACRSSRPSGWRSG